MTRDRRLPDDTLTVDLHILTSRSVEHKHITATDPMRQRHISSIPAALPKSREGMALASEQDFTKLVRSKYVGHMSEVDDGFITSNEQSGAYQPREEHSTRATEGRKSTVM